MKEAAARGLYNLRSTSEALPHFIAEKNVALFTGHHIFTREEIYSRYEILLENYCKTLHIEAKTMQDMICREFLPALMEYTDKIASSLRAKKALLPELSCSSQERLLEKLSVYYEEIFRAEEKLEADTAKAEALTEMQEAAVFYYETVLSDMNALRKAADSVEKYLPDEILPYPNYEKLLFSV